MTAPLPSPLSASMPARPRNLPEFPTLERMRAEARRLQRGLGSGDQKSLALARTYAPPGRDLELGKPSLATAQWLLARSYGSPSWPRLKRRIELIMEYTRAPEPAGDEPESDDPAGLADHLLRLGVLNYTRDRDRSFATAHDLLARHPELATADVFTMAVTGAAGRLRTALADDPAAANRTGGPYDWPPLLYLTSGRISNGPSAVATTRVLLAAGADPDAGYLWHGMTSAFTALTCVLGGGEQGQPPHPAAIEIARLLLEAGADPNDNQALYNRWFSPNSDHLELLFRYGLGTDRPSVWRDRLGPGYPTNEEMLGEQLSWAADHGFTDRVRLLLDHGVDPDTRGYHPIYGDRSAAELAAAAGHDDIVGMLGG
ncbi:hypothetical protein GCM10011575_37570 [Microlunatus endophyticus]|uniref:Ankyrin repeat-containing protein n=1 Tax=Microlunatus endophyticus TaxID=1716077 RepID=A0A917W879_9ACTN|nr:ankyrin repeat domain-containing protein [Microlunatus endophyticus]GGL75856.1 hypothetical protein GCM10011575_37570 [Microlunatus endophyticus]